MCGLQPSKGSETAGVSLIKAIIGTSFPTKPSDHLLPLPGSLLVERGVNGGGSSAQGRSLEWAGEASADGPGLQM